MHTPISPQRLWFKRKRYGWGWVPATWQGWLVTFVYVGIAVGLGLTIDDDSPAREIAFMFVLPFTLLTISFIRIVYWKGEKPRWQWGRENNE